MMNASVAGATVWADTESAPTAINIQDPAAGLFL